ncbi:MAG TPA: AAA domain-containing protein, partial [Polyangiales bacterium]|nr:AAA domain-containing protein [Polyangiales bacterium]
RLLQHQLGVPREHIDAFFAELRARPQVTERQMLERACELLEAELPAAAPRSVQTPLARLTAAASALLSRRGGRARVYPVGIVLDGTPAKTTWHLQRELQSLLDEDLEVKACLESYLTGTALPAGSAPQRALFPGLSLSESQRAAAERCWGSRLTAVQGPPGTGKTTLILHLAAQSIVQQVEALADSGEMGNGLFVVTSTNNRAVDNVVDPLTVNALPLALRAGSQRVCEHVLAAQLAGVRSWLDAARARPEPERAARLQQALDEFRRVRAARSGPDAGQERALFEAAVAAREAWAAAEGGALARAVDEAFLAARDERSLRTLWDRTSWPKLRQLFGVWGCTLLSLGNCFPQKESSIARLIVDEAGQCHPAYGVSGLLRAEAALIIGDVHQLEPVIDLEPDDDARVLASCKLTLSPEALAPYRVHSQSHVSVQSLADRAVLERPRLREHFRCQPEIIAICDALCDYGLRVHTRSEGPALAFLPHPVSLLHVAGEQERLAGSWYNPAELALSVELLLALHRAGVDPSDVAIITPYRGQLEQLRRQLARMGIPIDHSVELGELDDLPLSAASRGVGLGTVHRFQGGERSVVLFSSVVTRRASLGFIDDRENLLNVAVSRARHKLVVLGDRGLLESGNRTRLLVEAAQPVSADAFRSQLTLGA